MRVVDRPPSYTNAVLQLGLHFPPHRPSPGLRLRRSTCCIGFFAANKCSNCCRHNKKSTGPKEAKIWAQTKTKIERHSMTLEFQLDQAPELKSNFLTSLLNEAYFRIKVLLYEVGINIDIDHRVRRKLPNLSMGLCHCRGMWDLNGLIICVFWSSVHLPYWSFGMHLPKKSDYKMFYALNDTFAGWTKIPKTAKQIWAVVGSLKIKYDYFWLTKSCAKNGT